MKRLLPLLLFAGCARDPEPEPAGGLETLETAQRLAREGVERWPSGALAFSWIETVWHVGLHRVEAADGDARWSEAIDAWLQRGLGLFAGADPKVFDSSDSMSPSTLASLVAAEDPNAGMEPILDAAWQYLDTDAKHTAEGAITHWGEDNLVADSDEVWVDSQFMFGMFLLAEYDRTGERAILDRFVEQYVLFSELCRDPADDLYRHAYKDSTGENIPVDPVYWARGNSWVLISAAELLTRVPADHPAALAVGPLFLRHAAAVMALQAEDGLWHTVLNDPVPGDPANYTETSASALIGYALVLGAQTVLDPAVALPAVEAAVAGIEARIAETDGALTLAGTSVGTNPGQYAYYVAVPALDDQVLGVGSVLMFFSVTDGLGGEM